MTGRASALVLLVAMHAAGAQTTREVRFDAGAAQVQQTGRDARDAAGVFGISWGVGSPLFATMLAAAFTSAGDSSSAAQVGLAAAWRPTQRSRWQTEGGMTVAAFGASPLARGGSFSGVLRERLTLGDGGVWAGGAFGGTTRDDLASHSTAVEIGSWLRSGDFEATGSVSRFRSNDFALLEAAEIFLQNGVASYGLTDAVGELRYEHGPILVDATATLRHPDRAVSANQSALYFSAVWTLSPRYSFAVGTGRQLADPVRGVPDLQITSATLRIALGADCGAGGGDAWDVVRDAFDEVERRAARGARGCGGHIACRSRRNVLGLEAGSADADERRVGGGDRAAAGAASGGGAVEWGRVAGAEGDGGGQR